METPAKGTVKSLRPVPEQELVTATVAKGRTIKIGGRLIGPGNTVEMSAEEVANLRRLGFLVDPDAAEHLVDSGPTYVKPEFVKEPRRIILA